jgi:uncharacterized protein YukE
MPTIETISQWPGTIVLENEPKDPDGERRYKAILRRNDDLQTNFDGAWVLKIIRDFNKDGDWDGTPGSWFLDTLLGYDGFSRKSEDRVYIDFDSKWYVVGMVPVLKEAEDIVYGGVNEAKEEPIRYTGKFVPDPKNPSYLYHGGKLAGHETTKYETIDKKLTDKQYEELQKLQRERNDLDDQIDMLEDERKSLIQQQRDLAMEREEFDASVQEQYGFDVLDLLNSGLSDAEKIKSMKEKDMMQDERGKMIGNPENLISEYNYYWGKGRTDDDFEEQQEKLKKEITKLADKLSKIEDKIDKMEYTHKETKEFKPADKWGYTW